MNNDDYVNRDIKTCFFAVHNESEILVASL